MKISRVTLPALLVALALCPLARTASAAGAAAGAGGKKSDEMLIGYVNLQRAILEVEEGKRAKKALKASFDVKQKQLSEREEKLMKRKEEIEKQGAGKTAPDAELQKLIADFQGQLEELKKVYLKEQQELQEQEQKELAGITGKMRKVIEEIGEGQGYTLILEVQDSRLLYAKRYLDLTDEVIRKYNAKFK
jgi:outer membrane protein